MTLAGGNLTLADPDNISIFQFVLNAFMLDEPLTEKMAAGSDGVSEHESKEVIGTWFPSDLCSFVTPALC